ncbi:MAG: Gfo/Idh/MocA family oxidoreductase [Ferruginibacter sp.]
MKKINWGIIGCGDVTEVKSGPAFNKVSNSSLVAVMRRDGVKAKDYAERHKVGAWYDDASMLINDPNVNAIYIATPPSSHEVYTMAAIDAGKSVYVEKPMSLDAGEAFKMAAYADAKDVKLSVAHYRRAQPQFIKIKQLLGNKAIGDIRMVRFEYFQVPLNNDELQMPKTAWRIDPMISGGGLFHDLAPHQLDLAYYFFGTVERATGVAKSQSGIGNVDDMVSGNILFKNGVVFSGTWCFNIAPGQQNDCCEIYGSLGKIRFSVFDTQPITLTLNGKTEIFHFDKLAHVQQPMIEKVVQYFLDEGPNPCSGWEGAEVMKLIDTFTKR